MTDLGKTKHPDLVALAAKAGIEVESVTGEVLAQMADTSTPQGVIAVAKIRPAELSDILAQSPRLLVVLDRVSDPGNAGTIIRVAVAAGADAVIVDRRISRCVQPQGGAKHHGKYFSPAGGPRGTLG